MRVTISGENSGEEVTLLVLVPLAEDLCELVRPENKNNKNSDL